VIEVLRENGARVVTTARSIPRSSLAGVHYVAANITTAEGCTLVAHSALDHLGGIDIVVNVLGGSEAPAGGFAALHDEGWRKEINLTEGGGDHRDGVRHRRWDGADSLMQQIGTTSSNPLSSASSNEVSPLCGPVAGQATRHS
jgi:hypothetical protein